MPRPPRSARFIPRHRFEHIADPGPGGGSVMHEAVLNKLERRLGRLQNLASRATDARGARRPAKGRDREVVADHQGGEHQGGMKWLACLHFRGNAVKLPRRNFLHLATVATVLPAISRFAWAQNYPARPIWISSPPTHLSRLSRLRATGQTRLPKSYWWPHREP
jgi:hypothetical protein